jgi:hypothetical protein
MVPQISIAWRNIAITLIDRSEERANSRELLSATAAPTVKESIVHLSVAFWCSHLTTTVSCATDRKTRPPWNPPCSVACSPSSLVGYGRGLHQGAPPQDILRSRLTDHKGCAVRVGRSRRAQSHFAWSAVSCCQRSSGDFCCGGSKGAYDQARC